MGSRDRSSILHVFTSLEVGGAEARTLELVQALGASGPRQAVVTLGGRAGPLRQAYEEAGAEVHVLSLRDPLFAARFARVARLRQATTVHAHVALYSGAILFLARTLRIPQRIAHFRSDGSSAGAASLRARLRDALLRFLIDWCATDIIGVSPGALEHGWDRDWRVDPRCQVLLSGLDLSRFSGAHDRDAVRAGLGISSAAKWIAHVGRDVPVKNRARAVMIFGEILARDSGCVLTFIGREDDNRRRDLLTLVETRNAGDSVRLLGERRDVPDLLRAADVLLVTSLVEGMPGMVLEALASGIPVVASSLPGTRFIADTVAGVSLVDLAQSDEEWADAVLRVIEKSEERGRLSEGVVPLRGTVFDLEVASVAFVDLWRRVSVG